MPGMFGIVLASRAIEQDRLTLDVLELVDLGDEGDLLSQTLGRVHKYKFGSGSLRSF